MPPSARQNTNGPAMSVSWSICWSVPRSGLSTAKVCRWRWREREENNVSLLDWNYRDGGNKWAARGNRFSVPGLAWHLQLRQPIVIIHKQHNLRQDTTQFICTRHTAVIKPKNPRPGSVFEQFNQNSRYFSPSLPHWVCVCAFTVKFEKWKLMINDIADQWRAASRAARAQSCQRIVWRTAQPK